MRGRAAGVRERGQCAAGVRERGQCARAARANISRRRTSSGLDRRHAGTQLPLSNKRELQHGRAGGSTSRVCDRERATERARKRESGESEHITSYIERDNRIACTFTSDERSKMRERRERTSVHAKHKGGDSGNTKVGARVRYIPVHSEWSCRSWRASGRVGSKGRGRDS